MLVVFPLEPRWFAHDITAMRLPWIADPHVQDTGIGRPEGIALVWG
jgi:hypothetical protein